MESELLQSLFLGAHWILTVLALLAGATGLAVFFHEAGIELKRRRRSNIQLDFDDILDE